MTQTEFVLRPSAATVKNCRSPRPLPTQKRLMELFSYDENTGIFCKKRSVAGRIFNPHVPTGCKNARGYTIVFVEGQLFLAHRLAWVYFHGQDPQSIGVDHINGDVADNRIANLRLATQGENLRNACRRKDNSTGVKGVGFDARSGRFSARVRTNHKMNLCKSFTSKEAAEAAVKAARLENHGEFRRD
jgi:hypothetical protein